MANLLQAVLDAVDPDTGGDVQLVDVHVNVTADPAAVQEVGGRAIAAGAKWREEELDFDMEGPISTSMGTETDPVGS